jgi:predicted XRE-type DNA-binding protein
VNDSHYVVWQTENAERKKLITRGTGNVFADLGFPDAAERQAKLRLAYTLNQVLEARKLSQADAAKVLGVTQPKVSALRQHKLAGFSVERLMNMLRALGQDVEIVIQRKARTRKTGRITVVVGQPPMAPKPRAALRRPRSFATARRRALTRLREGLDISWTPAASRDELHGRGSERRDR